jgi:rhodanese-related sulfurtransferase
MEHFGEFLTNHWMLTLSFTMILALLIRSFIGIRGVNNVKPMEAIQLINHNQAVILDVRLENEFKEGHILNSIHIPVGLLHNRIKELDKYKSKPIIINCRSGNRSTTASGILRKQGFEAVHILTGGIMAWKNANLPLHKE